MTLEESEERLLEKAQEEERIYNWIKAASLYSRAIDLYLDKKLVEKAAENYKNLGYAHSRAADTVDTVEEYINQIKCAFKAYREAKKLFKQFGNISAELECEAEIFYTNGFLAASDTEGKSAYRQAIKLFNESSKIYSKLDDKESFARVLCRVASASQLFTSYNISQEEYTRVVLHGIESAEKAWEISKKIGNIQILSESLNIEVMIPFNRVSFKRNDYFRELMKKILGKCNESMAIIDNLDDPHALNLVYSVTGVFNCVFGYQFIEDE